MFRLCVLVIIVCIGEARLTGNCLQAIRQASNGEIGHCYQLDYSSYEVCGPYKISEPYWIDCGRPGSDYRQCTKYVGCSIRCMRAFFRKYISWCVGFSRQATCRDYVMILRGGAFGCQKSPDVFWAQVQRICRGIPGGCDEALNG